MYRIHKSVGDLRTSNERRWDDLCVKLPIVKVDAFGGEDNEEEEGKRPKRSQDDETLFNGDFEEFG